MKQYLNENEFHIINVVEKCTDRKIPRIDIGEIQYRGIEWDGAIYCSKSGSDYLFLVEAKTSIQSSQIKELPERIERTQNFMTLCNDGTLCKETKALCDDGMIPNDELRKPLPGLKFLCSLWQNFNGAKIRVAVGASEFSTVMIDTCRKEKFLAVSKRSDLYHVTEYEI